MTNQPGKYPRSSSTIDITSNEGLSNGIPETPTKEIEQLFEKLEAYSKTSIELAKLKTLDVSTTVVTTMVSKLVIMVMSSFFMLMLSIGASIWLGEVIGNAYYGYFLVAGFFLIITISFQQLLQPVLRKNVGQALIKQAIH